MKDKKQLLISLLLTIIAISILFITLLINSYKDGDDQKGKIIVEIESELNDKIVETITFNEDDTLIKILEAEYKNVVIENGMLMSIEELNTPSDWSEYIAIYVDDKLSSVGILDIKLVDGMKLTLKLEELNMGW